MKNNTTTKPVPRPAIQMALLSPNHPLNILPNVLFQLPPELLVICLRRVAVLHPQTQQPLISN